MHSHQFTAQSTNPTKTPRLTTVSRSTMSTIPTTKTSYTQHSPPRPSADIPLLPIAHPVSSLSQAPPMRSSSPRLPPSAPEPAPRADNENPQAVTGDPVDPVARPRNVRGPSWFELWRQGKDDDQYWWDMGWRRAHCDATP